MDIFGSVLREVGRHYDVSVKDIISSRRTRQVLPARLVSAYLMQKLSGASLHDVGAKLGGRDYTNIQMYCRAVERRVTEDGAFKLVVGDLEERIRSRRGYGTR